MPQVTATRKALWHSILREMGPVVAELTSKPRRSKFPNRPDYCHVTINGETWELQCETPQIAEQLQAVPLNTPLRITALGSKDAAHLEVEPVGQSENFPINSETSRRREVVEPTTTAQVTQSPTCSRGYWDALDVAVEMVAQFKARHGREPSEAERAIAATLYIEANKSGQPLTRGAQ